MITDEEKIAIIGTEYKHTVFDHYSDGYNRQLNIVTIVDNPATTYYYQVVNHGKEVFKSHNLFLAINVYNKIIV